MQIIKQSEYFKLVGITHQGLQKIIKRKEFIERKDYVRISGTPMIILNQKTRNYKVKKPGKAIN